MTVYPKDPKGKPRHDLEDCEEVESELNSNPEKYAPMDDHNFYFCKFCLEEKGVVFDEDAYDDDDDVFEHIMKEHWKKIIRIVNGPTEIKLGVYN